MIPIMHGVDGQAMQRAGWSAMPWRQEGLGASRGPKPIERGMSPFRASGRLVLTAGVLQSEGDA
jgi:hypothetical protein